MISELVLSGNSLVEGVGDDPNKGGWAKRVAEFYKQIDTRIYGFGGQNILDLKKRYTSELQKINSAIVFYQIGLNDSRLRDSLGMAAEVNINLFTKTYQEIIQFCKTIPAIKSIYLLGLPMVNEKLVAPYKPDKSYFKAEIVKYNLAIENIAQSNQINFIQIASLVNPKNDALVDGLHPNSKGHEIIFTLVCQEINKYV